MTAAKSSPRPDTAPAVNRTRTSRRSPGPTRSSWRTAHFVPTWSGLTVALPWTTASLIPSFGNGDLFGDPNRRSLLVSLSQKSAVASGS